MTHTHDPAEHAGVGLETLLGDVLHAIPARAAKIYTPELEIGSPDGIWKSLGSPEAALQDYMAHFRDVDVWARVASRHSLPPTGTIINTDRLMDQEVLHRSEFHNDYLRPYDIGRCLVAVVDDGRSSTLPRIRLTVMRAPSEPLFSVAEVGRFWRLARLARSFVRLASAHETVSRSLALQQSAIDLVRMPILLTDCEGRLLFANRSANVLLHSDGPLLLSRGRLRVCSPPLDRTLGAALSAVAAAPRDIRYVRLGPGRPLRNSPALLITALAPDSVTGRPAAMMVRVLGSDPASADGESILTQLLGLTPAETAVALGLAEGLSHDEIARRRGVKITTVRTTLRRLQEKLSIDRTGPLARFIVGVTAGGGLDLCGQTSPPAPQRPLVGSSNVVA